MHLLSQASIFFRQHSFFVAFDLTSWLFPTSFRYYNAFSIEYPVMVMPSIKPASRPLDDEESFVYRHVIVYGPGPRPDRQFFRETFSQSCSPLIVATTVPSIRHSSLSKLASELTFQKNDNPPMLETWPLSKNNCTELVRPSPIEPLLNAYLP